MWTFIYVNFKLYKSKVSNAIYLCLLKIGNISHFIKYDIIKCVEPNNEKIASQTRTPRVPYYCI